MAGYHYHKCDCGAEWGHDLNHADGPKAYAERHQCTNCGADVRRVSRFPSPQAEREYENIQMEQMGGSPDQLQNLRRVFELLDALQLPVL